MKHFSSAPQITFSFYLINYNLSGYKKLSRNSCVVLSGGFWHHRSVQLNWEHQNKVWHNIAVKYRALQHHLLFSLSFNYNMFVNTNIKVQPSSESCFLWELTFSQLGILAAKLISDFSRVRSNEKACLACTHLSERYGLCFHLSILWIFFSCLNSEEHDSNLSCWVFDRTYLIPLKPTHP